MFSRRSALILGDMFQDIYTYRGRGSGSGSKNDLNRLYDYLYENEYSSWFCNTAKNLRIFNQPRAIKELIMKLHTGETQYQVTSNWTWEQRKVLGQNYLVNLSEDILRAEHKLQGKLINSLELDGYKYNNGKLILSEVDILEVEEETGVLESLYTELDLNNRETALHHLKLSSEHYLAAKWDDSISNSRKYMESVLREIAYSYNEKIKRSKLSNRIYESPREVRSFLESEGILETKETKTIAAVYGLLSNTGSHPYIADNDQARLLRHLSLTITQFVMLRFEGSIKEQVSSLKET
ncbi:hypothetical protein JFV29_12385 [Peribacillus sp. TH16]|uniref:hypothetical protein n=1 Tax=Peribacillus sp. TH16 TaxID=2798482 RepID=UPI0019115DC4|nr:hypothetical protein [Peribacillus sp. TH16]MBK5482680.1 hypothetical protein [Peribacillus sp. TH16]